MRMFVRILMDMTRPVTVQLPEETAKTIDVRPERLPHELREAAVLKWFEEGRLSQGQASSTLELTRGEFFDVLAKHHVSPIQLTVEELEEEFRGA
jgi:predicted HTH domain antitoxin